MCGGGPITSKGDLVQKTDNAGNATCYTYDGLHRALTAGNSTISGATLRKFVYDTKASLPTGVTVANGKGRMIEAQTTNAAGSTVITDEYFSYSKRSELTDVYELTPHSSGFYHTTAAYWPTGALETLSGIPGVPTINYGANGSGLDGEGRVTQVTASTGTNPVTGVTYSLGTSTAPLGALTGVTFGSADSDSFTYDPNTGRMAGYTFSVNGKTDVGALTWNTNGTLQKLVITDSIPGTADSQSCTYGYDDVQRISNVTCGTLWAQNFSYDAFGNISKNVPSGDGGLSFLPTYWTSPPTNQFMSLPGVTAKYDANGNLLTDNLNTYTWDANWGNLLTVNTGSTTVTATYDALGRMVENNAGGSFTEFLYGPTGKLAKCNGQTLVKAFIALPGGAKAIYNSTGLAYYRHSDWLGSSRLTSTATKPTSMFSSSAYAPFGEQYATAGSADASYTGQDQDTVSSLYDFPARRQSPSQGRWISPDPAGRAAVRLTNPQSWNRYAYVNNNPLRLIDAMGLDTTCDQGTDNGDGGDDDSSGGGGGCGDGGSGGGGGDDDNSGNGNCDPTDPTCNNPDPSNCDPSDPSCNPSPNNCDPTDPTCNSSNPNSNPPCTVNVAVGSVSGVSPALPAIENNINQYFQSQAGISVNFVQAGDPTAAATLNFVSDASRPPGMSLLDEGATFTDFGPGFPFGPAADVYVNTQNIAQQMAFDPNGSYIQGVTMTSEHELAHGLTNNEVGNSDTGLMAPFDSDPGGSLEPPSPDLSPDEIQQLQDDNCPSQ